MNNLFTKLVCVFASIVAFACGQASAPAPKAPIYFGESEHVFPSEDDREQIAQRAQELRKLRIYSKGSIATDAAKNVDTLVVSTGTARSRVATVAPKTDFGDLTSACEELRQIIGYESTTPLFGSDEGAAEYALAHPELFPASGVDAAGHPTVTLVTRPVCRDKRDPGQVALAE